MFIYQKINYNFHDLASGVKNIQISVTEFAIKAGVQNLELIAPIQHNLMS